MAVFGFGVAPALEDCWNQLMSVHTVDVFDRTSILQFVLSQLPKNRGEERLLGPWDSASAVGRQKVMRLLIEGINLSLNILMPVCWAVQVWLDLCMRHSPDLCVIKLQFLLRRRGSTRSTNPCSWTPTAEWSPSPFPRSTSCRTVEHSVPRCRICGTHTKSIRRAVLPSGEIQVSWGPWCLTSVEGRHRSNWCSASLKNAVFGVVSSSYLKTVTSSWGPLDALASHNRMSLPDSQLWQSWTVSVHHVSLVHSSIPLWGPCKTATHRGSRADSIRAIKRRGSL